MKLVDPRRKSLVTEEKGKFMADLKFSKEGAGLALGIMAIAMANGADLETAFSRVHDVFGGAKGIAMRMKATWTTDELKALAHHASGLD